MKKRSIQTACYCLLILQVTLAQPAHLNLRFLSIEEALPVSGLSILPQGCNVRMTDNWGGVRIDHLAPGYTPGKSIRLELMAANWHFYQESDAVATLMHPDEQRSQVILLCQNCGKIKQRQYEDLKKSMRALGNKLDQVEHILVENQSAIQAKILDSIRVIRQVLLASVNPQPAKDTVLSPREKNYRGLECKSRHDTHGMLRWWTEAAQEGDANAQNNLGAAYLTGADGLSRDCALARKWLACAAAKSHPVALANYGTMLYNGDCLLSDKATALRYWQRSDSLGCALGTHALGFYWEQKRKYRAALACFERNAERDYAPSLFSLGIYYYRGTGKGLDKDRDKGCEYLLRSVNLDYTPAIRALNAKEFNCTH